MKKCVTAASCQSKKEIAENVSNENNIFYYWTIPADFGGYSKAKIIIASADNSVSGTSDYFSIIRRELPAIALPLPSVKDSGTKIPGPVTVDPFSYVHEVTGPNLLEGGA